MPSRGLYAGLVACFVLLNHFASAIPGLYKDQRPLITASSSLYEKPAAPYVGFDLSLSYGYVHIPPIKPYTPLTTPASLQSGTQMERTQTWHTSTQFQNTKQ